MPSTSSTSTGVTDRRSRDEAGRHDDPLSTAGDPVAVARQHIIDSALTDSVLEPGVSGRVGLELELHLVDLAEPGRRPTWTQVQALAVAMPPMPAGSPVTLEPGGQIELSTPPAADVVSAVADLSADLAVLRRALRQEGFGAAGLGTDLARPVRRINPSTRYAAMEQHFDALGCAGAGQAMMTATAALQVNLDAGPAQGWEERLGLVAGLVPVLVAASATSPYLAGRTSGWHSMRQGTWQGIDHGRSDPLPEGEPRAAWAFYALSAPVLLVHEGSPRGNTLVPVTERVPFAAWLQGVTPRGGPFDRRPTLADLDYHLTTLFPPVRPRGYVEIRCLDALPDRWWPALAALTVTLVDDPVAADRAAELCEPLAGAWELAARDGMSHSGVRRAVTGCVEVALARCPDGLRPELEAYAALLDSGSDPSSQLRDRIEQHGPLRVLEEESR